MALSDLGKLTVEHRGVRRGRFFHIPKKFFGKECTQLYKVYGFEGDKVYAQRINKRSGKMPGNALLWETFNFDKIFPNGN